MGHSGPDRVCEVKKKSRLTAELKKIAALSPEKDCLGKNASDIGTVTFDGGKVTGTLKKVTGYTGFSGSQAQQEGYYLAFGYSGTEDLQMNVRGAKVTCDKGGEPNIAFLGKTKELAQEASLHIYLGEETHSFPMTGITFEEG